MIIHNLTTTAKSNTYTLEMLDIRPNRMKSTLNTEQPGTGYVDRMIERWETGGKAEIWLHWE